VWPRGWVEVQLYSSMSAALERGEWSAARPGCTLLPGKTRYPFTGGWVGPRAGLDIVCMYVNENTNNGGVFIKFN